MFNKDFIGALSLIVAFMSYLPYVRSMFAGKTKPHAFSWLVWGTVISITFFAQYTENAGAGSWATGLSACACLGIGIAALFRGEKNITKSDWLVFLVTLSAIPLWIITHDPFWSVVLVTGIDAAAYFPTFRKSYAKPDEEAASKYVLTAIKYLLSLVALENYSIVTTIYPFVSFFMEISIVAMLLWRRNVLSKNQLNIPIPSK